MKKYFFTAVAVLTIAASGVTYMQNQKPIAMNDLALENVEALALGEVGNGFWCCDDVSIICNIDNSNYPFTRTTYGFFRAAPC